jgi:hypothetical protein
MPNKKTKAIVKQSYAIDKPEQMAKMAIILKQHIIKNNLYVEIVNKNYVMVEGWQFAGGLMGLFPRIVEVKNIGPMKWQAQADLIDQKTGKTIGSGFAICSKEEMKKQSFDEYAILSMAQTRAIGKAYRNLIGWVMKLAGYEPTPAEEMKGKKEEAKPKEAGDIPAGIAEITRITNLATELGLKTTKQISDKIKLDFSAKITKNKASQIYAELLKLKIK